VEAVAKVVPKHRWRLLGKENMTNKGSQRILHLRPLLAICSRLKVSMMLQRTYLQLNMTILEKILELGTMILTQTFHYLCSNQSKIEDLNQTWPEILHQARTKGQVNLISQFHQIKDNQLIKSHLMMNAMRQP
jgi:hypothetical protein